MEKTFDEFWEEFKNEDPELKKELEDMEAYSSAVRQMVVARVDCGLSQKELANRCGLSESDLAKIENLDMRVSDDTIKLLLSSLC